MKNAQYISLVLATEQMKRNQNEIEDIHCTDDKKSRNIDDHDNNDTNNHDNNK